MTSIHSFLSRFKRIDLFAPKTNEFFNFFSCFFVWNLMNFSFIYKVIPMTVLYSFNDLIKL